ncbi:inner membrane protein yedR [Escherichia coli PA40]|nr:inner membrane protein yedR [Escherichia coli PA40]
MWAFYTWCGYFVWAMARYIWVMSRIPDAPVSGFESDLGSTAGKWLGHWSDFYLWLWSGHC